MQPRVPAFTVPQPEEAMRVLEEKASEQDVCLEVALPLDAKLLGGLQLGLKGDHQYINAGLAIALCSSWLQRTGHLGVNNVNQSSSLPEQFIKGLITSTLQGRAQVVPDCEINTDRPGDLMLYLDGAHSPESMDACARWFSLSIKEDNQPFTNYQLQHGSKSSHQYNGGCNDERSIKKNYAQILLFNCMSVRDPQLLLPRLVRACANNGVHFKKALFVPNESVYYKVGTHAQPPISSRVDLSWQLTLQRVWENMIRGENEGDVKNPYTVCGESKDEMEKSESNLESSVVFPSLPSAIKWLRDSVRENQTIRFQVLVTGSLHLVGDVLRLVKK